MRSIKSKLLNLTAAFLISLVIISVSGCAGGATSSPNPVNDEPAAVTNLTAKAGNSTVLLRWTNPTAASFESLEVICSSDTASTPRRFLPKTTTKYEVTELTNGTEYSFYIIAYFGSDEEGNEIKKVSEVVSATPVEKVELSSVDFAKSLVVGWNLGNTLDAGGTGDWDYNNIYNGKGSTDNETSWGMAKTTEAMIKKVHSSGFETIRIPISWHNHISKSDTTNYKIDDKWMARVKEVVDYAYNDGMYVIINIHHDNMSISDISNHPGFALSDNSTIKSKSKTYISKVWNQIAATFADYDEKLIFEVLNEPRDVGGAEFSPSVSQAADFQKIITEYEQVGLDAIRAAGGNNSSRFVMVPAYAASTGYLDSYTMPTDSASDKLLLSTHAYSPYDFAMGSASNKTFTDGHRESLRSMFNDLKKNYTAKGIGVVMGEASATDKNNLSDREAWTTYYFTKAAEAGIPVVLWDNDVIWNKGTDDSERHGWFNRTGLSWYYPTIIEKMITAAKTDTNLNDIVDAGLLNDVFEAASDWSKNTTISGAKFLTATNNSYLKFTVTQGGTLKMQNKWGEDAVILQNGTITGGTKNSDNFNISKGTVTYKPVETEWNAIKESGLIIYGTGFIITKVELVN